MESMYRRAAKDGDEVDAFSRIRGHSPARVFVFRAGERHKAKHRASRRTRRQVRVALRGGLEA